MLSGVLRGESPAVDARPALSTPDSIVWTDRALMRPDQVFSAMRYGVYAALTLCHPARHTLCQPPDTGSVTERRPVDAPRRPRLPARATTRLAPGRPPPDRPPPCRPALMRPVPRPALAVLPHAGSPQCTPGAAHR